MQDAFLTKTLTTSGASAQYPTGAISDGGSAVDEWNVGVVVGAPLYIFLNIESSTGTSETMTPTIEQDDAVTFGSATVIWTCPFEINDGNTPDLFCFKLPDVTEENGKYIRFSTGSIGGSGSPGFTFSVYLTTTAPHGRIYPLPA